MDFAENKPWQTSCMLGPSSAQLIQIEQNFDMRTEVITFSHFQLKRQCTMKRLVRSCKMFYFTHTNTRALTSDDTVGILYDVKCCSSPRLPFCFCFGNAMRQLRKKKAYVRLTQDYDALDVANRIGII